MSHRNQLALAIGLAAFGTAPAFAGGLDQITFNPNFMFDEGRVLQVSAGYVQPTVSPTALPSANIAVAGGGLATLSYKQDFGNFSAGLLLNANPMGADVTYAALGSPLAAKVTSRSLSLLGKYKFGDRFSLYGGVKYQTVNGTANLAGIGVPVSPNGSDTGFGAIVGAAFEVPNIALRVALTYESAISYQVPTGVAGNSTAASPDAIRLDFQTGIAPDTLLFGSIRQANWSRGDIILPAALGSANLTNFSNVTTYSLGVGRKFGEKFSASLSVSRENGSGAVASPLSPINGTTTVSLGLGYDISDAISLSGVVNYSMLGDATTSTGVAFSGNSATSIGLQLKAKF